jgi:hypothetical protein
LVYPSASVASEKRENGPILVCRCTTPFCH